MMAIKIEGKNHLWPSLWIIATTTPNWETSKQISNTFDHIWETKKEKESKNQTWVLTKLNKKNLQTTDWERFFK